MMFSNAIYKSLICYPFLNSFIIRQTKIGIRTNHRNGQIGFTNHGILRFHGGFSCLILHLSEWTLLVDA